VGVEVTESIETETVAEEMVVEQSAIHMKVEGALETGQMAQTIGGSAEVRDPNDQTEAMIGE